MIKAVILARTQKHMVKAGWTLAGNTNDRSALIEIERDLIATGTWQGVKPEVAFTWGSPSNSDTVLYWTRTAISPGATEQKAVQRFINAVWTLTFKVNGDTVEIVRYTRDDQDGINREHYLPKCRLLEDKERTVIGAVIDGKNYTVSNPLHVFSYGC